MKKVIAIIYPDDHDVPYRSAVGDNGVTKIEEHPAQGEGDKWYYDIYFEGGEMARIFNVSQAFYRQAEFSL